MLETFELQKISFFVLYRLFLFFYFTKIKATLPKTQNLTVLMNKGF